MGISVDENADNNIDQRCDGNFSQKIMQVLVLCLIFLAVENVQLVRNERLDAQEVLDSTHFKNAVAKELLKKKLSNLESSRQQDSLASFLKKGGRHTGLRTGPKSNFHKDDDPSRKQAQMANTFIASSNLLFGAKSQPRKSCGTAGKQANKEVLDMGSLRQLSGYNEDGSFTASKESSKPTVLNDSLAAVMKKRLFPRKAVQDPISCYLSEPKKVTCIHKDLIYKIALPSSNVADNEIGRIVESIYRAVEGNISGSSLDESIEGEVGQKTSLVGSSEIKGREPSLDDSLKKKRASDDYLKSVFLNNLLMANKAALPNYNVSTVFVPFLIPMAQPKPAGYYSGLAIDPRLQIPVNFSAVDAFGHQTGRNAMFENGYGQYLVTDGLTLPELNVKQRSQANQTEEEEKRRNWLALMATNGLVPIDNKLMAQSVVQYAPGDGQGIAEEKNSLSNKNKLTVAETGEVLDKLLNKRQERDTYFLKHQLRKRPYFSGDSPKFGSFHNVKRNQVLTKVVQKLSDPGEFILEEKKGCPCPGSTDLCATPSRCSKKSTKCPHKFPTRLIIQLNSSSAECSSTESCSTTPKCSMCPDVCQPSPSKNPTECSTTNGCAPDILSRVVSGVSKSNGEPAESRPYLPLFPVQTSHLNWLPYSPQSFQQNRLSNQPEQLQRVPHNEESHQPYSQYEHAPTEGQFESAAVTNTNGEQFQNGIIQQHSEKPNAPLENPQASRLEDHTQFSPQNKIGHNEIMLNNDQQPIGQRRNVDGSIHDVIRGPGSSETPSYKHPEIVLQSKPVQEDGSNVTSRHNDIKTKKHRDSFFARLRSKFYKGLSQEGTEFKKVATDRFLENQYNQTLLGAGKGMIGTSIFKFSPRNQTFGFGKYNSSANQLNKTNNTIDNEQLCVADQMNQSNPQLANQTQPTTVHNINITITPIQPHNNSQSNQQQAPKMFVQCQIVPSTTQPLTSNGQNSRICTVTKIWLCSQPTSTTMSDICGNVTQPPICTSIQTTTQPSTCQTPSTARPSTCQIPSTTRSSTCQIPSTTNSGSCAIQDSLPSLNVMPQMNATFIAGTKLPQTGVTEVQYLYPHSGPSNKWPFTSSHQAGPNVQDNPHERPKNFYNPPPGWNQWQYPIDRMNYGPTERVLNLQQPSRMPPAALPQQKQFQEKPSSQMMGQPGNPAWHQNYLQPQSQFTWQQPLGQQLDPRWRAPIQMGIPNEHQPNSQPILPSQPIKNYNHLTPRNEINPYDERKSMSDQTMGSGKMMDTGKHHSTRIIEQDIARVRRYLWKKRSKTSNHHLSRKS